MGLIFKKVVLHNFLSYNHAEFDLQNKGFCLITGENNYAKDNAKSNGAGKSAAFSAICFAITGMTISGLHTNLKNIFNDEPDSYVELSFSYNKDNYVITRYIAPKSDLTIIQNDINVSGKGIKESSKKLEEMLPDLNRDLIASTILLGQGMPAKFSSFSPSGRKELLEKLTKSDFMLEDIKTRLSDRQAVIGGQETDNNKSIIQANSQKGLYEAQIDQLKDKKTKVEAQDLSAMKQRIGELTEFLKQNKKDREAIVKAIKEIDEATTKELAKKSTLITAQNEELNKVDEKYRAEKPKLDESYSAKYAEASLLANEIQRLEAIKDTCPTCGQKIPGAHKPDTTEQRNKGKLLAEEINKLQDQKTALDTKYNADRAAITKKYEDALKTIDDELKQLAKDKQKEQDDSDYLYQAHLTAEGDLKSLVDSYTTHEATLKTIDEQIDSNIKAIEKLDKSLETFNAEKLRLSEHSAVLKKMDTLIKRDFRGYLLQNIIQFLDTKAKEYCQIVFGTKELSIYLDGNNLDIKYCGKMLDNLSGGERQRCDLIIQLSIRDLMCSYFGYTSNILVLDEITDYLDSKSCSAVMNLVTTQLQNIESVFIISHHSESLEIPIDSEIKIIKSVDGISEICAA